MIITRSPLRVSLGGGGTDLPSFYREHGGFIFAVGLDKYMYLNVKLPILEETIRVQYSKLEIVENVEELKHTLAREALRFLGIENGIEIVSIADIPSGTGLGSSSCYLVGLLNALHCLAQSQASPWQLAEEACDIELQQLQKPIGKQDQYMAAFGGLTTLDIKKDGTVSVSRTHLDMELLQALESNIFLFYTGGVRDATAILQKQDSATRNKDKDILGRLLEIKDIGIEIRDCVVSGNLQQFGKLLDLHWQTKKRLSNGISNPQVDAWYDLAKRHGAIGGKISGAGGGGFLMLYCEDGKSRLREVMRGAGLRELHFRFEFEGSKVVFDAVSRDNRLAHNHRQERNNRLHKEFPAIAAIA
jgi:D-glycero-alpha-D-manno-heptose-7-phosphate kinase